MNHPQLQLKANSANAIWHKKLAVRQMWGLSLAGLCLFACLTLIAFYGNRLTAGFLFAVISAGLAIGSHFLHANIGKLERAWVHALREETLENRKTNGLMQRNDGDIVVSDSDWTSTNSGPRADWLEGEPQTILVGDKVIRWNHGIAGGLAVERNGRIVAVKTTHHISVFPDVTGGY